MRGLSEVVATEILKHSNVGDFVYYYLCEIKDSHKSYDDMWYRGCYSYDFKSNRTIIPLYRLLRERFKYDTESKQFKVLPTLERIQTITSLVNKLLPNFGEWLTLLLEFDALILNEDRHFNNILIMLESDGITYSLSPIFNCGAGFMSDTKIDYKLETPIMQLYKNCRAKPFSNSFSEQVVCARELYGPQLKLTIPKKFQISTTLYNNDIVDRVNTILKYQFSKWSDMFI